MIRLDLDLIRHALKTASDRGFASVEIGLGEDRFEATLLPRRAAPARVGTELEEDGKATQLITSTAVGYFRGGKRSLAVGMEVLAGEMVAEIVSLGLTNEVVAKWSGTVTEVLVEADQPVEYGQPIARMEVNNE